MRLVGCDALFFWTKTMTFSWSGKAAAHWKESRRPAQLPPRPARGSALRKTFRSISHKGAERLQWVLEGRCHSPLSWASSGTGAVLMGLVSLWANPRSMWQQHQEEVFSQCRRLSSCWRGTAAKSHKSFCLNETWDGLCRIDCFSTHSGCSTMSLTLRAGNRAFHGTV